jgi:hypothetical protein
MLRLARVFEIQRGGCPHLLRAVLVVMGLWSQMTPSWHDTCHSVAIPSKLEAMEQVAENPSRRQDHV